MTPPGRGSTPSRIGTLNEKPLHAALKAWYREPGDRCEAIVEGFHIDLVRGGRLIEIQTRNFAALKRKLRVLTERRDLRLVHPIPAEKWLVKLPPSQHGEPMRRRSPKRGSVYHLFEELVNLAVLMGRPRLSLEVLITREEEVRRYDPNRAWRRRGWVIDERRLLEVVESHVFTGVADLAALIPRDAPAEFTTAHLAEAIGQRRSLARKMAYCLRALGAILPVGKEGNAIVYERALN
jgi:hypothetical protein